MVSHEAPSTNLPVVVVVRCVQLEVAFFIDTPTFWQVVTTNVRDCEGLAKEFGSRVMLTWMWSAAGAAESYGACRWAARRRIGPKRPNCSVSC
jgi:hypothetical protein